MWSKRIVEYVVTPVEYVHAMAMVVEVSGCSNTGSNEMMGRCLVEGVTSSVTKVGEAVVIEDMVVA